MSRQHLPRLHGQDSSGASSSKPGDPACCWLQRLQQLGHSLVLLLLLLLVGCQHWLLLLLLPA